MITNGNNNMWSSVTPFIVGLVSGIGAGILMAPQSGARTRRQLQNLACDLEEQTDQFVSDARASLGKVIERGKRLVV